MKYVMKSFLLLASLLLLVHTAALASTTVEVRVGASNDDAEERANHSMYRNSTDLELIHDSDDQTVGMRFGSVTVPQNATIVNAYLEFTVDETGNTDGSLTIHGQAADNPPSFSDSSSDISGRTATSASVSWVLDTDNRWNHAGDKKQTPDLKTIVQELVYRAGWSSGQAMVFIITGSGKRVAESYDGSHSNAPLLHIEYEVGAAAPVISIDPANSLGASSYVGVSAIPGSFTLSNTGSADLNYSITDDASWLSCSTNCSGTLAAGGSVTVGVTYDNYTMAAGSYTGHFTVTDTNAINSPFEYDVLLLIQEVAAGSTCGEVPIYAQNLVDPAILVLLDVSSSMNSMMPMSDAGDNPTTPDLKTIVQEIVDRGDWASGQSMAFIISGTGERVAESYDGVSSSAPLLSVEYTDGGTPGSVEVRVAQSNDDAEESSGGDMYLDSSDLEMVYDGSNQTVGIRFQDVTIPPGAVITSASIQFTVDEPDPTVATNLTIAGEATGDALVFADAAHNISGRTATTATVAWNIADPWDTPPEKARYVIGREVISELVGDTSISWGYGTWAFTSYSGPGSGPDLDLLPDNPYGASETDLYTKIHAGVQHRTVAETEDLQSLILGTVTTGGTPFGPSLLAAREYFDGNKADEDGDTYDSSLSCQPKFLIDVTDGQGYSPHTSVDIINKYTDLLADEKISSVAVGFGIAPEEAAQIYEMAKVANARGNADDDLYALHEEDVNGDGVPFIAQNQEELTAALQSITNSIKQQIFIGSSPAPSTSVDAGTFVINATFNAATWAGDLTATPYDQETGAIMMCVDSAGNRTCDSANIYGKCPDVGSATCASTDIIVGDCLCWTASENMPATKNAWTVDGDVSASGALLPAGVAGKYVDDHTSLSDYEIGLDGDNYICRDLGDIIKSTPVIVESPHKYYGFDNYRAFKFGDASNRDDMLYVGANDGALHAFGLETGVEEWRFYPEALHQKLIDSNICADDYCHEYFVDGTPVVADVYLGTDYDVYSGTPPTITQSGWRTLLLNGLGAGGDALFALDITSGTSFVENGTDPLTATTYLWQFTDDELGLTMGKPAISHVNNSDDTVPTATFGGWAAFFGSGYDAAGGSSKEAYVFGIEAYSMDDLWDDGSGNSFNRVKLEESDRISYTGQTGDEFAVGQTVVGKDSAAQGQIVAVTDSGETGTLELDTISGAFTEGEWLQVDSNDMATVATPLHSAYSNDALSDPVVADLDFDNFGDYLYIGNMYGKMYRMTEIGKNKDPEVGVLFDIDPLNVNHNTPIRAGAAVGYDSGPETIWVYFGTGRFEEQADKFNTEQQYFVGVKDFLGSTVVDSTLSDLLERTTVAVDATFLGEVNEYRIITGQSFVYQGTGTLTAGHTMQGVQSGATGQIESIGTLNSETTITFVESTVNGTFIMGEEIFDTADASNSVTLQNYPWYVTLQHTAGLPSERVVASPLVAGGVVFFTSFIPDDDVCGGNGEAWLYALDYETGLPPKEPVFDVNGDGVFDEDDMVTHDDKSYPVAAIPIGRGIPSAPVLEGDMIFVNTTDATRPGLPVNLPTLKAALSAWKDRGI